MFRKNRIAGYISFIILLHSLSLLAQDGVALLKNEHGARSAGMGETVFSIDPDPNATSHNPAMAAGFEKFMVSFGHTEFWENVSLESGYFAANLNPHWAVHGGIRYASVGNLQGREFPTSAPETEFDAQDISFKGGFAYSLTSKVEIGVAAGWIIEKIGAYRGSSFNVDLGTVFQIDSQANIAAAVTNLGSDFQLEQPGVTASDEVPLPTTYRIGGSYKYQRFLGAAELVYLDDEAHAHLGAEAKVTEIFSLRTGYMINYDSKNFTAGASFAHRNISVEYAFVPFSQNLGTSHLFNLTFGL
ncbi:MAG: PorV/PorQ family protein [Candidatus Zixiibacteriota bacterium]